MSDPNASSGVRFTVFDYLGLAFLLGPPSVAAEILMRGENIPLQGYAWAVALIAIGGACVIIGRKWEKIRLHAYPSFSNSVDRLSRSYSALFLSLALVIICIVFAPLIAWSFDQPGGSQFFLMQKANNGPIRMVGFTAHGRKQSFEPTTDFNGVIRSDLTNEETPLLLMAQPDPAERQPELPPNVTAPMPTPPEDTYGIPGFAEFDVATYNKVAVSDTADIEASSFLRNFGPFTMILDYDGVTHRRHFSKEQIETHLHYWRNKLLDKLPYFLTSQEDQT